ncbi:translesion DNA synthesis-associated protein ImuA [Teredinibacter turnerae]|uniref:translesion DNA synthesis-associated protein ImuA n=1 Tax=Teredinibacter turnerae TaxID=2426 RepID=UPI000362D19E|nr:translesion DNA synthesis-associated protein ImuA [Teredinibacter turnerae]
MSTDRTTPPPATLEQLLQRGDVWRGHSQYFISQDAVDTGYPPLNSALLNNGWPLSSLIEICQPSAGHGDWLLTAPCAQHLLQKQPHGYIVLLNPPALPFSQGMLFSGIPLEQLVVVQITAKNDFIASFVELARASSCALLMAWQPKQALTYTELRKCQLATADGSGVYLLFRHNRQRQESSPASLRLTTQLNSQHLQVHILKQRGQLRPGSAAIDLPLPDYAQTYKPHRQLEDTPASPNVANDQVFAPYQPRRNVLALRINRGRPLKVKRSAG